MLNLSQQLKLGLKLTPQQVQYLKLLQLPTLSLEQRVKMELELNPVLEIDEDIEQTLDQEAPEVGNDAEEGEDEYTIEDYLNDDLEGYKSPAASRSTDDDEYESPIPNVVPLSERLLSQFRLQNNADEDDILLAEEIIGNVDEDGYLRRELGLIVQDLNLGIGTELTVERAEKILQRIQLLEPPGIGARTLQECLTAQVKAAKIEPALKELATKILQEHFEDFKLKRFESIAEKLGVSKETLKLALDLIQHLNPKPGEGEFSAQENYVTPDYIVHKDDGDFVILLNDRNVPPLRLNREYRELAAAKNKKTSREAKDFIKKKFESAKWFIASLHQRRETLMKVMKAIVDKQREWFEEGEMLKPMIYREVADIVGVDISTISRVVRNKYVQTEFGVFPLKHYFTSGLESESGEDISNLMVKRKIKDIIEVEDSQDPLNDDKIAEMLQKEGIRIARRTVAKYREQLGVPIARLRKKY
ncbi:MAG: RNA polymerase factor sigma-54 [Ignavibacteriae bacterium]|nr:RNA polymerase factor sigma-54 [Ignavibacteriota bacterium]